MGRRADSSGRGELEGGWRAFRGGSCVTNGECETLDCPDALPLPLTNRADGEVGFINGRE
jgi:hypothetical protein